MIIAVVVAENLSPSLTRKGEHQKFDDCEVHSFVSFTKCRVP